MIPSTLEKLVLQGHVILWLETDACTEYIGQRTSLLSKCIDDWGAWRSQGSFEHVAKDAENAVEVLEILVRNTVIGSSLPLDTSHHLSDENEVNDQWGSKKRVLADIEKAVIVSRNTE
jgi:hypothetical protein